MKNLYPAKLFLIKDLKTHDLLHYEKLFYKYEYTCKSGILPENQFIFENDYFFMVGDNRHFSFDSRGHGAIPKKMIVGKVFFICAPNLQMILGTGNVF